MLHIKLEVHGFSKMSLPDQYLPFAFSSSALHWRVGTLQPQHLGNRWQGCKNKCIAVLVGSGKRERFTEREHLIFAYILIPSFPTSCLQTAFQRIKA